MALAKINCELKIQHTVIIALLAVVSIPDRTHQMAVEPISNLYGPNDKVVVLNSTTIKKQIYGSSRAWLVEFFSSWCGHCIHFAPKWIAFADNVSGWDDAVAVAGIDCADENNIQTCREYEIMGYPSLLIFPPNAENTIKDNEGKEVLNRGSRFTRSDLIGDMRHLLMENLTAMIPKLFPTLTTPITEDENQFWSDSIDPQVSFIVVVFEGQNSTIGKEVALELSKYQKIRVYRFNKRNPLYSRLNLEGWPAAGFIKRDSGFGPIHLPKNVNLVEALKKGAMVKADIAPSIQLTKDVVTTTTPAQKKDEVKSVVNLQLKEDKVSMEDLIHAVRNSLHNDVRLAKTIEGPKLTALKNYLSILSQLFPADRRETKLFFLKFETWVQPLSKITDQEYFDKLTELEVDLHPWDVDISTWQDCKGSIPGRRGYTCGLWRLFHTLTIIALEKNDDIKVLDAIHGYVKEFFGCTDCSQHFTTMVSKDNALFIKPVNEQALWLWRAHNKVNLRTKGTVSEDPSFPKQLYPNIRQCPKCFVGPEHYDEKRVADYLISVYSKPQRMTGAVHNAEPLSLQLSADGELHGNGASKNSFFSLTDIGIFMVVYVSVVILLVLGYIHFRMVSKRRLDSYLFCRSRRLCSNIV